VRTETNLAARKFYAQRNTYLTGFALFLSLVLTRVFYIILDLIHTQEEYAKLKKQAEAGGGGVDSKQLAEMKSKIAAADAKDRDLENLKKQALSQAKAYDELATKYNAVTGQTSKDKKNI